MTERWILYFALRRVTRSRIRDHGSSGNKALLKYCRTSNEVDPIQYNLWTTRMNHSKLNGRVEKGPHSWKITFQEKRVWKFTFQTSGWKMHQKNRKCPMKCTLCDEISFQKKKNSIADSLEHVEFGLTRALFCNYRLYL